MKKEIHNITIIGRRWFDKVYGKTYHSVAVWVNGKFIAENPYEYGYGDQYIQSAFEILQQAGFYPKSNKRFKSGISVNYNKFLQDQRNHRNKFIISVSDVGRKKDL